MIILNGKSMCEYCFCETEEETCPNCGYNHEKYKLDKHILPIGSVLSNRYKIGGVIGKGGFGITYYAYDLKLELRVAVKEYYPFGVAARDVVTSAVAAIDDTSNITYKTGMEKFYEEAKLVAKFNSNPNIVSVHDFFYENDTVYYVMDLISGKNLKEYLKENSTISYEQALYLMSEVASGLCVTHSVNVLHRDVSPDNIMLCDDGTIKLLDFGAARQVIMEGSQSLSVILKQGFAPFEQYQRKGKQGPWTDIYALGATVYYAITGEMLEDPMTRFEDDEEYQSNRHNIPEDFWNIIKKATAIQGKNRYQSAKELLEDLSKLDINAYSLTDNRQMKKVKPIGDTFGLTGAVTSTEVEEDYGKTMPLKEEAVENYGKTMPLQEEKVEDYGKTMPLQEETVPITQSNLAVESVNATPKTNPVESVYVETKTSNITSIEGKSGNKKLENWIFIILGVAFIILDLLYLGDWIPGNYSQVIGFCVMELDFVILFIIKIVNAFKDKKELANSVIDNGGCNVVSSGGENDKKLNNWLFIVGGMAFVFLYAYIIIFEISYFTFLVVEMILVIIFISIIAIKEKKKLKIWPFIVSGMAIDFLCFPDFRDEHIISTIPFFVVEIILVIILISIIAIKGKNKTKILPFIVAGVVFTIIDIIIISRIIKENDFGSFPVLYRRSHYYYIEHFIRNTFSVGGLDLVIILIIKITNINKGEKDLAN